MSVGERERGGRERGSRGKKGKDSEERERNEGLGGELREMEIAPNWGVEGRKKEEKGVGVSVGEIMTLPTPP